MPCIYIVTAPTDRFSRYRKKHGFPAPGLGPMLAVKLSPTSKFNIHVHVHINATTINRSILSCPPASKPGD